jgi:hypothetical protein
MSDEAVQIQQQLRLAVSDPEKNQLRHQLQVRPPRLHTNTHRLSLLSTSIPLPGHNCVTACRREWGFMLLKKCVHVVL